MITIRKLTAGYGKLEILQDLSLSFAERQFSAVLGPNGSGKSTLMKAIMNLNTVFGGSIQLRERELIGEPTEAISRLGIAYVPQRENIFDELTVLENLQLGARILPKPSGRPPSKSCWKSSPSWGAAARSKRSPSAAANIRCWRSPSPGSASRRSCCWTSRARAWPRPSRPMSSACWVNCESRESL